MNPLNKPIQFALTINIMCVGFAGWFAFANVGGQVIRGARSDNPTTAVITLFQTLGMSRGDSDATGLAIEFAIAGTTMQDFGNQMVALAAKTDE
jgi:hypothetical protein